MAVSELICGRVIHGNEFRSVDMVKKLHFKTCEVCRNSQAKDRDVKFVMMDSKQTMTDIITKSAERRQKEALE